MGRKERTKPIDPATLRRGSLITMAQAARMIAPADWDSDDVRPEQPFNRVKSRIRYAVTTDKLRRDDAGQLVFGELAAWAQDTYPGNFLDWPAIRLFTGKAENTLDGVTGHIAGVLLPPDLPECHERIKALAKEVAALRRENEACRREVAELRLCKAKREKLSAKLSACGTQGGRGHSK